MGQPPMSGRRRRRASGRRPYQHAPGAGSVGGEMNADRTESPPDLQTQLEAVLHAIWDEEERWRREERIDLAVRLVRDS
jgi:hypothetical protein